jgi:hypothetical protein
MYQIDADRATLTRAEHSLAIPNDLALSADDSFALPP